jgi:hypothetical protein
VTELLFKVLNEHGRPHNGGTGDWPLPSNGKPGKWLRVEGDLVPCENGIHLCRPDQLVEWLGPTIWLAEAGKERIDAGDKIVVRRARLLSKVEAWDDKSARLFAADCAHRALMRERRAGREPDKRSWDAVRIARNYARGKATAEQRAAAWAAAWAAARDAAWAAAWDAAWAAAGAAAGDAAGAAAGDAAGAAAGDVTSMYLRTRAERQWQTKRLMRYLGVEAEMTPALGQRGSK